jgi:hypothetical protein
VTQQGPPPPPQPGKTPTRGRPQQWGEFEDTDSDLPPWAGLGVKPRLAQPAAQPGAAAGPQREAQAGAGAPVPQPGSRRAVAAARARRARRVRYLWAVAAVAVVAAAVVVVPRLFHHPKPQQNLGNLVTTFQPGEFQTVPHACAAVTAATLGQYLPGTRRTVAPGSLDGNAQSMCDWTVDTPPTYRLLNVSVQAYAPSGLASGNGSATNAAMDAYQQAMQAKAHPPKKSRQPAATITALTGTGSAGFSALQVLKAGGDTTDLITVVARQRNVLVTVVFDGLAHAPGGKYGPVDVTQLQAGAAAAAHDLLAALH